MNHTRAAVWLDPTVALFIRPARLRARRGESPGYYGSGKAHKSIDKKIRAFIVHCIDDVCIFVI